MAFTLAPAAYFNRGLLVFCKESSPEIPVSPGAAEPQPKQQLMSHSSSETSLSRLKPALAGWIGKRVWALFFLSMTFDCPTHTEAAQRKSLFLFLCWDSVLALNYFYLHPIAGGDVKSFSVQEKQNQEFPNSNYFCGTEKNCLFSSSKIYAKEGMGCAFLFTVPNHFGNIFHWWEETDLLDLFLNAGNAVVRGPP